MMESIVLLLIFSFIVWFWLNTLQCREIARNLAKKACHQLQLQLLDDTLSLINFRLKRNQYGSLNIQRTYQFEFFAGGDTRQKAILSMYGNRLEMIEIPGYLQRTISPI